jgi:aryl-alcohol dehydrogenase-like predicted oxidoreductase
MGKTEERRRLDDAADRGTPWKKWGPHLSERQWGTVREDYGRDAWSYFSHEQSRSRAYRWGEDGLGGFCDDRQRLCFGLALWNERDPILKERLFGLTNGEGNHGEDAARGLLLRGVDPPRPHHRRERGRARADGSAPPLAGELRAVRGTGQCMRRVEMDIEVASIPDIAIPVGRIGLGTWAMGGFQWGGSDDDESVRTIHVALERGINLIDTAPAYGFGHSEEVIGRAIAERGQRDRVVVATKVGLERRGDALFRNGTRRQILDEVDLSLFRLRTDYIDLCQVHWPDPLTPYEETAEALRDLKDAGKILAIGVSNYSIEAMERFGTVATIASAQPPLNLFERQAESDIIPWCLERGVATLTYGSLCRGLLSGAIGKGTQFVGDDLRNVDPKFQPPRFDQYLKAVALLERYAHERYQAGVLALAIRWVLDTPGVSVALWGPRHPSEVVPLEELMRFHLDDEARAYINAILAEAVQDPVGPEFMAPPARPLEAQASAGFSI